MHLCCLILFAEVSKRIITHIYYISASSSTFPFIYSLLSSKKKIVFLMQGKRLSEINAHLVVYALWMTEY